MLLQIFRRRQMDLQETDSSLGGHAQLRAKASVLTQVSVPLERGKGEASDLRAAIQPHMFRRDFAHAERTVFHANAVDRGHRPGCSRALPPIRKDHGEHVLLHYYRKA